MVSLQCENQKDQHWERKRQSDRHGGLREPRFHGARTAPAKTWCPPAWAAPCQLLLISQAQRVAAGLCHWLGEGFAWTPVQTRSFLSHAVRPLRQEGQMDEGTAGQTNGWILQRMSRRRGCMNQSSSQVLAG